MAKRPVTIVFGSRAKQEIEQARAWWDQHRDVRALDDAIAEAARLLTSFPEIAPRVQIDGQWSTTRRLVLEVGYHLYYQFDARKRTILVRCFWHERRPKPRL